MLCSCSSYEREKKREKEIDREVENLLDSKIFVLIDENRHKIIAFKFTQRKYALVIMTGISTLSIKVDTDFCVKSVTL
jgi:hypothetical protein